MIIEITIDSYQNLYPALYFFIMYSFSYLAVVTSYSFDERKVKHAIAHFNCDSMKGHLAPIPSMMINNFLKAKLLER